LGDISTKLGAFVHKTSGHTGTNSHGWHEAQDKDDFPGLDLDKKNFSFRQRKGWRDRQVVKMI
jgi:hypothetical protein